MNEDGQKLESEVESARIKVRARWELASVLNFLKVFQSIISSDLKISAEEIEQSLILPDKRLRLLHIMLLKGIPPVSRNLNNPDAWVVMLSKKLFMWWPWVAEGDFPLTAAKGAEMEIYKNLDPTVRLVVLKALCEIRADQHDVVAYINDEVKIKKDITAFRKKNIGEDGKGTYYWLDGNETIGFRLYKEVNTLNENEKPPTMNYQWETLATNLEEFQKVVEEYSSSESKLEVAVSAVVETEAMPILNKMFKKKQSEMVKKLNEERIINNFSRSGITRSCRNRNPITYTFDEYDKVISNAIRESKTKTKDEQKSVKKATAAYEDPPQDGEGESTESDENDVYEETDDNASSEDSGKESDENAASEDSGEESDGSEDSGEESDENAVAEDSGDESDENDEDKENMKRNSSKDGKKKFRDKKRIEKEESDESVDEEDGESTQSDSDSESSDLETKDVSENNGDNKENTNNISKKDTENDDRLIQEKEHFGTKKRLVQRPNRNTALESAIVPDSDEEVASDNSDD